MIYEHFQTMEGAMDRKLFGFFTAWQITLLLLAAILAPSSIFAAAVATQAVSITNPTTGVKAAVDVLGRLSVYDPVAGYANSPLNYVRLGGSCINNQSSFNYKPPQGKALIITDVDFRYYNGSTGADNFIYLVGPTGTIASIESVNLVDSKNANLATGYYLTGSENLESNCSNGYFFFEILGYLVPSNAVPAAQAGQSMESHFLKNGRQL